MPAVDIPKSKWVGTGEKMQVLYGITSYKLLINSHVNLCTVNISCSKYFGSSCFMWHNLILFLLEMWYWTWALDGDIGICFLLIKRYQYVYLELKVSCLSRLNHLMTYIRFVTYLGGGCAVICTASIHMLSDYLQ